MAVRFVTADSSPASGPLPVAPCAPGDPCPSWHRTHALMLWVTYVVCGGAGATRQVRVGPGAGLTGWRGGAWRQVSDPLTFPLAAPWTNLPRAHIHTSSGHSRPRGPHTRPLRGVGPSPARACSRCTGVSGGRTEDRTGSVRPQRACPSARCPGACGLRDVVGGPCPLTTTPINTPGQRPQTSARAPGNSSLFWHQRHTFPPWGPEQRRGPAPVCVRRKGPGDRQRRA